MKRKVPSSDGMECGLLLLPDELLRNVLQFLTCMKAIMNSKRDSDNTLLHTMSLITKRWKTGKFQSIFHLVPGSWITIKCVQSINPFSMSLWCPVASPSIAKLELMSNLRILNLGFCTTQNFSNLTGLTVFRLRVTGFGNEFHLPMNLKTLAFVIDDFKDIHKMKLLCPPTLESLLLSCRRCSSLGELMLNDNLQKFDVSTEEIPILKGGANLSSIKITDTLGRLGGVRRFPCLAHLVNLRKVDLVNRNENDVIGDALIQFGACVNVQHLSLLAEWPIIGCEIDNLLNWKGLTMLRLLFYQDDSDSITNMKTLFNSFPNLEFILHPPEYDGFHELFIALKFKPTGDILVMTGDLTKIVYPVVQELFQRQDILEVIQSVDPELYDCRKIN
jgi:hypothetical protein